MSQTRRDEAQNDLISRRVLQLGAIVVALASLASPGRAQETRQEFWPELNVYWRLNAVTRLYFLVAPTINRQEAYGEAQYGAHVEFGVAPIVRREFGETYDIDRFRFLRFRVGLRYGSNLEWSESQYTEWRGILEITPRYLLPFDILVAQRNRIDLRWLNGRYSTRFRPRIGIERETPLTSWLTVIPFGMFEIYYDSRYATWNRTQLKAGVGVPLFNWILIEASYVYQHDIRSEPTFINAFGLGIVSYF